MQERVVREIRMLRAMRRGLETGLRRPLHGHEGGNPGHSQGAAYGLPRQFPTLPAPGAGTTAKSGSLEGRTLSYIAGTGLNTVRAVWQVNTGRLLAGVVA